ncbi:hypothetical protein [Legionella cardiaca]|uniref:Uncharacterized protein n=1 Tax=Legionella cardiaca TaxID=1071983 RepID=A0ABY8ARR9_9GAMM|nr:hypothetical protein [Legionella cardiaca]WED41976.1 hypothetical protein PXX05_08510 [Legionella cardiaca]
MPNRHLVERLNKELDNLGVPSLMNERINACSKIFNLPKFKIEAALNGIVVDEESLTTIADELEISREWLVGQKNRKEH